MESFFKDFLFQHGEEIATYLLVLCALSLGFAVQAIKSKKIHWSIAYCFCVTILCIMGRTYMMATQFPLSDESEQIAAAHTVLKQGNFYGQVLVGTHGPLMTFILVLLNMAGMPLDSTCVHLFTVFVQIFIGFVLLAIFDKLGLARLSLLASFPYFSFVAFALYPELTTYNAEIITSCFPLVSLYFLLAYKDSGKRLPVYLSGFFIGFIPFLKIQFLPSAFALIAFQLFFIAKRSRYLYRDLLLCFSGLATAPLAQIAYGCINPLVFYYYAQWVKFQTGYLEKQSNTLFNKLLNIYYTLVLYSGFSRDSNIFINVFMIPIASIGVFTLSWLQKLWRREFVPNNTTIALLATLCYAAIASAIFPGRPFVHYILAFIPFMFILYGYILYITSNHCSKFILAFLFSITSLLYPLSSITNENGHHFATASPLDNFSGDFLTSLKVCASCANGLFVTNPHYELYAAAKSGSPLKELSTLFDFLGNIHSDKDILLATFQKSPPSIIVSTDENSSKFSLESNFPELLHYIKKNYSECSASNNSTLWRYIEPFFNIFDICIPCNIKMTNFSNKETDSNKKYEYFWTTNESASISFQAKGETYQASIKILSPLFDNTIEVLVNDTVVDTFHLPQASSPAQATHRIIEFPTAKGNNRIQWRIAKVNNGDNMVLPHESRLLGIQVLEGVFCGISSVELPPLKRTDRVLD